MENQSNFATRLAGKFLRGGAKNVVFSPPSIHSVTSLIAAGASGATLEQTLAFLGLNNKEELVSMYSHSVGTTLADGSIHGGPLLSSVNGVWLDQSMQLQEPFKEIVDGAFKARAQAVDFQYKADEVREEVNSWAKKETRGLIEEILPVGSVNPVTRLILANALYFKGSWVDEFDAADTTEGDYHTPDGKTVQVPFMTNDKRQYVSVFDGFKVLELPYKKGNDARHFSLYIFLPDAMDGLEGLVERMRSEHGFLDNHVPRQKVSLRKFKIPKFKISCELELSRDFKDMGLELPFKPGGLMEMVTDKVSGEELYVSGIFHKSFIEVNEVGTEAAAVTAAMVMLCCFYQGGDLDFVADHPFAFVLKENTTGVVLFAGSVVNPLENN